MMIATITVSGNHKITERPSCVMQFFDKMLKISTFNFRMFLFSRTTAQRITAKHAVGRFMYCEFLSSDKFAPRHLGPNDVEQQQMLNAIGCKSLDELTDKAIPESIRLKKNLQLPKELGEEEALKRIKEIASKNKIWKSYIGMGFNDCILPSVIRRNVFENLNWLTPYTPYQPEISQGRLESLMNYQTMVCQMTSMDVSNASLLDEATACAEAMQLCYRATGNKIFFVDAYLHPQNIAVCSTRAQTMGIQLKLVRDWEKENLDGISGAIVQYPNTEGALVDYSALADRVHSHGGLFVMATDLLACALIRPPGEYKADVCVGNTQRFGLPLGYGGPHSAFIAVSNRFKNGALTRLIPGRIVGLSKDRNGSPAYRLALQTREQHIRRGKATSNICTSQALLANLSAMYAIHHGPVGLKRVAKKVHDATLVVAEGLKKCGFQLKHDNFFDTLTIENIDNNQVEKIRRRAEQSHINLRYYTNPNQIGISLNETVEKEDLVNLLELFDFKYDQHFKLNTIEANSVYRSNFARQSAILTSDIFNSIHSEQMFVRYIEQLQSRDVSLVDSAIPLGSCTMKLNSSTQLTPCSWPEFCNIHPFVPAEQAAGYRHLLKNLEDWLCEITGFDKIGAQGEFSGLITIRGYLHSLGQSNRDICLIPVSAHGTNPASARMAGFTVENVKTDHDGNIDFTDLKDKVEKNKSRLACMMITYPSTFGVFEERIKDVCQIVHEYGGQLYFDGANMNAQVGLCRPGDYGFDVCHLNLHKTFCIPHGGGGPGMGPIAVKSHLAPFLPSNETTAIKDAEKSQYFTGPVSSCASSSASILPIPWTYIATMGCSGLRRASQVAILNANYMAKQLSSHYKVLYRGASNFVAHEFLIDCREFKKTANVEVTDIAKRLMDYGFHAPTVSFPIAGCLMIEPTETEDKRELDWLCEALIMIRKEIADIEQGKQDKENNVLKMAPHNIQSVCSDSWNHPYSRQLASFPTAWSARKVWPFVARIDEVYGDMHLKLTR
ncbi:Glycine dehydrogenase [decarboxylating], mitochondrial [Trichinella zimbabwensis]|uniref:Glycine cleavage system P protein n=1 Tax=Trichinella zimbabwensis TaxID=268475 RepID=A0A0V1HQC7_9BILA|nr:Glycine dehydrogenase [decarboxylating], mitochondrial [Trichinella zimbabwensis]